MKCPLKSWEHSQFVECQGRTCAFADEAGDCLVRQALQCYVSAERTRVAEENDRIRRENEAAMTYWKMYKNGTREPIKFEHNDKITIDEPKTVFYHACSPEDLGF